MDRDPAILLLARAYARAVVDALLTDKGSKGEEGDMFFDFLIGQIHRDDGVGELARMARDENRRSSRRFSANGLRMFLTESMADDSDHDALTAAMVEYENTKMATKNKAGKDAGYVT
jgi:hypothetical protein